MYKSNMWAPLFCSKLTLLAEEWRAYHAASFKFVQTCKQQGKSNMICFAT